MTTEEAFRQLEGVEGLSPSSIQTATRRMGGTAFVRWNIASDSN